ncbi:peptidase M56 [Bacillus thuringiensis serovar kyushuensis]|uniref:peptidase M56 n=1 Tax=Bacillus cereus group TaxID=86661 RepID=UPI000B43BFD5|nr:peptidase M56 [Bacillus thuringiensis]MEC2866886.1 peptidase M56 [Bacillus cereus]OTZ77543.1 peptidase M56 [Bacillus thuringiensis serovar kyushuensis]OTZ80270.1 peptidase M56 [Bacillus thuringiensis serovar tohokuensis]OUB95766.1 peptidase M56 [Bacillus thuringiensis serovar indiana]PGP42676.1 peptidase M56 [Bacillus thuringiensis]
MSRRFALTYENKILRKIIITVSIVILVFIATGCDSVQNEAKDVTDIPLNSKLDSLISESIIAWNQDKLNHTEKQFETHVIYGTEMKDEKMYVYLHSLMQGYNRETQTVPQAGHLLPVRVTVTKNGDDYIIEDYREPGDGAENEPTLRNMFPNKYADQALAISNKIIQSLESRMQESVSKWLEETNNERQER